MDTADRIFEEVLACMAGRVTPEEQGIIDGLTYRNYRFNRQLGVSAADLLKLWPLTGEAMELRYSSEVSAYADAMTQRDKEARHEGRPEHDLDVVGRALRAGT